MNGVRRLGPGDADLAKRILTDPSIYEIVSDDNSPAPEEFDVAPLLSAEGIYFLHPNEFSIFIFHPWNAICYEVHSNVLPGGRGKMAMDAVRRVREWMFEKTPCQKIVTHVPFYNVPAFALAIRAGMKREGINRKSFLKRGELHDQIILGICKEEVEKCPQ